MIEVVAPTKGKITIEIPYEEGEAFLRAIGLTNTGDLRMHAPKTLEVIEALTELFGRNSRDEAHNLFSFFAGGQIRIDEV